MATLRFLYLIIIFNVYHCLCVMPTCLYKHVAHGGTIRSILVKSKSSTFSAIFRLMRTHQLFWTENNVPDNICKKKYGFYRTHYPPWKQKDFIKFNDNIWGLVSVSWVFFRCVCISTIHFVTYWVSEWVSQW